jgi:hypothetical protein
MVAAIANQPTREGIAQAIANQIQQKYLAEGVQVHLTGDGETQPFTARTNHGPDFAPHRRPERVLAITSGPALIGEIDIWQGIISLPSEEDLMLQTMLRQTAAALDRVRMGEAKPSDPKQRPSYSEGNSPEASHS